MCVFHRDDNIQLSVDGIPLGDIAKQYGSPVYVYSAAGITKTFTRFQNAVAPMNGKVYFAMKANSALGILALIGKLGGGMDIVSAGSLTNEYLVVSATTPTVQTTNHTTIICLKLDGIIGTSFLSLLH